MLDSWFQAEPDPSEADNIARLEPDRVAVQGG
jgi:hypothetical protein